MLRESQYQAGLIKRLRVLPCVFEVVKNDSEYIQGLPDLTVYGYGHWAWLEVKRGPNEPEQPNQRYYIEKAVAEGNFAAFIFPENEAEVLEALQEKWGPI